MILQVEIKTARQFAEYLLQLPDIDAPLMLFVPGDTEEEDNATFPRFATVDTDPATGYNSDGFPILSLTETILAPNDQRFRPSA